jgi:hypothetical protein
VKVIAGSGNDRISVDVSALLASAPQTQIDVVGGAGVWPPLLSTAQAFALIDPRLREVARCLGLSRSAFVFKIGLPSMTHDVVGALRVSISLALILTVLGEMLSAQDGLGYVILLSTFLQCAPIIRGHHSAGTSRSFREPNHLARGAQTDGLEHSSGLRLPSTMDLAVTTCWWSIDPTTGRPVGIQQNIQPPGFSMAVILEGVAVPRQ